MLFHAPDVKLVALFSPEHGIRGAVDAEVADSKDEATGLPIVSLYGKTRKPSRREPGKGVDVLVYDIQDIGARFYTYISTLGLVLEAAKEAGKPAGRARPAQPDRRRRRRRAGPRRRASRRSSPTTPLPVRHGMTVGELARLFNAERTIGADLTSSPARAGAATRLYDRTGLIWVNPSPNMRSLTEALLYPGVGLLEATNLATGRGTDTPFERVGAPWIEPSDLARALNDASIPGVRFVPIRFTPSERQYAGERCGGVQILIDDWRGSSRSSWGSAWRRRCARATATTGSPTASSACSPTGPPIRPSSTASRPRGSRPSGSRNWPISPRSATGI